MKSLASRLRSLVADRRGTALIEFAIVLPMLVALLFGMLSYGQYFLIAHDAQQLANDAARATVAGLSSAERRDIAIRRVREDGKALSIVDPDRIATAIVETSDSVTVTVRIDARAVPLIGKSLVPMPAPIIVRRAVVAPGGIS